MKQWQTIMILLTMSATSFAAESQKKPAPAPSAGKESAPPANEAASAAGPAKSDDKVDISDIENKYWAPKDTDFSVVQNRTYTKEKKYSFSLLYGPLINETFSEGKSFAMTMNYFYSERNGIQFTFEHVDSHDSSATRGFIDQGGGPNYGRVNTYYGIGYNFVPFYAKMSVLGKRIIYFDMAFTPNLGLTKYDQLTNSLGNSGKTSLTYGFDISQMFFLDRWFALRVDLKQRWFKEEVLKYQSDPGVPEGSVLRTKMQDNTLLLFGAMFFF